MSTEKYTRFKIFKCDTPATSSFSQQHSLLEASSETLFLFAESYSTNVDPADPTWSLAFVGTQEDLVEWYIPEFQDLITQRLVISPLFRSRDGFRKLIINELTTVKPISVVDLSAMEHDCFYIRDDDYPLAQEGYKLSPLTYYGKQRFGGEIRTEEDIKNWVHLIHKLKNERAKPVAWFGETYRLSSYNFHTALNKASKSAA